METLKKYINYPKLFSSHFVARTRVQVRTSLLQPVVNMGNVLDCSTVSVQ